MSIPKPQSSPAASKMPPSSSFKPVQEEVRDGWFTLDATKLQRAREAASLAVFSGGLPAQKNISGVNADALGISAFNEENERRRRALQLPGNPATQKELLAAIDAMDKGSSGTSLPEKFVAHESVGDPKNSSYLSHQGEPGRPQPPLKDDVAGIAGVANGEQTIVRPGAGKPAGPPPQSIQESAQANTTSSLDAFALTSTTSTSNVVQRNPEPKPDKYITLVNGHAGGSDAPENTLNLVQVGPRDQVGGARDNGRTINDLNMVRGLDLERGEIASSVTQATVPRIGDGSIAVTFKVEDKPKDLRDIATQQKSVVETTKTQQKTQTINAATQTTSQTIDAPNPPSPSHPAQEGTSTQENVGPRLQNNRQPDAPREPDAKSKTRQVRGKPGIGNHKGRPIVRKGVSPETSRIWKQAMLESLGPKSLSGRTPPVALPKSVAATLTALTASIASTPITAETIKTAPSRGALARAAQLPTRTPLEAASRGISVRG